jgi:ribosomal protein L7/L12
MQIVEQILDLFDELDGYESIELIEALAERGYELKCNHELEKKSLRNIFGLFLITYNDDKKIQTIKLIRNTGNDYKEFCKGHVDLSLREAKDFVEKPALWSTSPFVWGTRMNMKILYDKLMREMDGVTLKIKEFDVVDMVKTRQSLLNEDVFE